jgi:hypothetical protein
MFDDFCPHRGETLARRSVKSLCNEAEGETYEITFQLIRIVDDVGEVSIQAVNSSRVGSWT